MTIPLLVFGLLLIALPSFVLGREFSKLWDAHSRDEARIIARELDQPEQLLVSTLPSKRMVYCSHETHLQDEPTTASLARQIIDLQGALDSQGQMLRRLLKATEDLSTSRNRNRNGAVRNTEVLFDASDDEMREVQMRSVSQLEGRNSRRKSSGGEGSIKGKERADPPYANSQLSS